MKKITVLGSTGSVGSQALSVCKKYGYSVESISGFNNIELLVNQINFFAPKFCFVPNQEKAIDLRKMISKENSTEIISDKTDIIHSIEKTESDVIIHGISGLEGIDYAVAASKSGKRLAIANKESIIAVPSIIFENIKKYGGELIPVDSEHSAIFQALRNRLTEPLNNKQIEKIVKRIILTASGGPFFDKSEGFLKSVSPEMALNHPTWNMGKKITIDSATMMNKGFEVIEAANLFNLNCNKIDVVIQRQSIIHSMVEYKDNSIIAQLDKPTMEHPIEYAISYPDTLQCDDKSVDFSELNHLDFDNPDFNKFRCLKLAYEVAEEGGILPSCLVAADEVAVSLFLNKKIMFNQIPYFIENVLNKIENKNVDDLSEIKYEIDNANRIAQSEICSIS